LRRGKLHGRDEVDQLLVDVIAELAPLGGAAVDRATLLGPRRERAAARLVARLQELA
jgi:hypothetical protein